MPLRFYRTMILAVLIAIPANAIAGKMSDRHKKWLEEDAWVLVTKDDEKAFKDLKDDADRDRFIEIFWARRDPTPLTPANEFKSDYEQRLAFVRSDRFLRTRFGIKSDAAHIYLLLGQPEKQETLSGGVTWIYPAMPKFGLTHPLHFRFSNRDGLFELSSDMSDGIGLLASIPAALILHPELHDVPTYPHMMDKTMIAMIDEFAGGGPAREEVPCDVSIQYLKSIGGATYVCLIADMRAKPAKPAAFGRCIQPSATQEFNEPMETTAAGEHTFAYAGFAIMAGKADLLLGIMDKSTNKVTLRKLTIDVPNFDSGKIEMTAPQASDKIEPVQIASSTSGSNNAPVSPFTFGHYRLIPKADAVYSKDSSLFLFYNVYNYGLANSETQLMVEYVFNRDGQYFNRIPAELTQQKPGDASAIVLGTEVPLTSFPPGKYTATVKIDDRVSGAQVARDLQFEVK